MNATGSTSRPAFKVSLPFPAQSVCFGVPRWKRILDITCILLATPLLVPLGLLLALCIKIASPGPALFKQERMGYRGRRFLCFKFRTMVSGADTRAHAHHMAELIASGKPMIKLDAVDNRLIPGGAILRALGLDELPQLLNVLRGDMSLVGPRPCIPYECDDYEPSHWHRFDTLPGLTGLWQVSGKNRTTFEQMIDLDLQYVERKSLLLDLKIMARTLPAIIGQVRESKRRRQATASRPDSLKTGRRSHPPVARQMLQPGLAGNAIARVGR